MSRTVPVYTPEFKQQAIDLMTTSGSSGAKIARDLGIAIHLIPRWKKELADSKIAGRPAFTGRGHIALSEQEAKIRELERELFITRQERDILKKAMVVFAKT